MPAVERFDYSAVGTAEGDASLLPLLPITLQHQGHRVTSSGLLDSRATVNVLPYDLGVQSGAVWEQQTVQVQLTGNLANFEARALVLSAVVGNFAPVRLVFAWTRAEKVPLILGQVNFFMEYDICFYRAQKAFEIRPRS